MRKSIHSPEYQRVLERLVEMRKAAGLTQRDLAKRLRREQSFVWRIETGERRLDVVEFFWVCRALGADAAQQYASLVDAFRELVPVEKTRRLVAEPKGEYGSDTDAAQ